MLKIESRNEGNALVLTLHGRLDTNSAQKLEKVIEAELPGTDELILECRDLSYISSFGIRVILEAEEILDKEGAVSMKHCSEEVRKVLDITGLISILNVSGDQDVGK